MIQDATMTGTVSVAELLAMDLFTEVKLKVYVPEGWDFIDEGWSDMTFYVTSPIADMATLRKIVQRGLSGTEITKMKYVRHEYVRPFKFEFFHSRCDKSGDWVD